MGSFNVAQMLVKANGIFLAESHSPRQHLFAWLAKFDEIDPSISSELKVEARNNCVYVVADSKFYIQECCVSWSVTGGSV